MESHPNGDAAHTIHLRLCMSDRRNCGSMSASDISAAHRELILLGAQEIPSSFSPSLVLNQPHSTAMTFFFDMLYFRDLGLIHLFCDLTNRAFRPSSTLALTRLISIVNEMWPKNSSATVQSLRMMSYYSCNSTCLGLVNQW